MSDALTPQSDLDKAAVPRCRRCGYVLALPEGLCSECGRSFDLDDPNSYVLRPPFLFWRYWLPGACLALGGGFVLSFYFLIQGNIGFGLCMGVPFAMGAILGYGVRGRYAARLIFALCLTIALGTALIFIHPSALICGLFLMLIFLLPVIGGCALGILLRVLVKRSNFDQRWHLPILFLFLLLPHAFDAVERLFVAAPGVESISTAAVLQGTPRDAWNNLKFYEEVAHRPGLLLRLGLPRPQRTQGRADRVGDVKVCLYEHGVLRKLITDCQPGRQLAFDVIQQEHVQDHAIRLLRGSFQFEAVDTDQTRVTLTTEYQPLMTPRWCWRPIEQLCGHALHAHILEGMRLHTVATGDGDDHRALANDHENQ